MADINLKEIEEFDEVVMIGEGESFDRDTGELLDYDDSDGDDTGDRDTEDKYTWCGEFRFGKLLGD